MDYIISEELLQRIQHFDFLGEFIAQCIASAGRTIELAPGYKVIMPSIMVDRSILCRYTENDRVAILYRDLQGVENRSTENCDST